MSNQTKPPTGAEQIVWDLSDLYDSVNDPAIDRDLDEADARADDLAQTYRGRIAQLGPEGMCTLLEAFETTYELSRKVNSYAYLNWSVNTEEPANGALLQKATERASRLNQKLVFVELEWAQTPDEVAQVIMQDPRLSPSPGRTYRHWLEVARRYRPYLLSEAEEKILAEKAVTGRYAWMRFFDEVHSATRYKFNGKMLPQQTILTKLYDPDRDIRRQAAASVTAGLNDIKRITTYVFNSILADKASDDRLRNYPSWITARNMDNEVADETVDALISAVTSRYKIVARYYRLKRRLLGLDELFDYDRYAPLPAADRHYGWEESREIVLNAYASFHPRMAETAQMFFENRWIDAAVKPGKRSGAYSHSTVPSAHPYVFINYEATSRDVMTLAHELGHAVHQTLARVQGMLQAGTPLTTAETASVFGEMLVFQHLMSRETERQVRLAMLVSELENSFATVFRQISMNRFEEAIHTARREEGELTTERYNQLWLETQRAMFQDSVTMTENYGLWWSYIPHFVHTPGYVYAYAFGELLALALYARHQEVGGDFPEAYLNMLSAGGSEWPHLLLQPLGVDLTDPNFWGKGLQMLDDMVSEAEELAG
ncbi:MAG: M3 family oligoendopeptidase [Anaerolineae bacterium]